MANILNCQQKQYVRVRTEKLNWHEVNCMPSDWVQRFPEKWVFSLTPIDKKILDYLFNATFNRKLEYIYVRQDTLAKLFGCTREWINKRLLKLERMGVIVSSYRHMTSCLYKISKYFNNPAIQSRFEYAFKSLRALKRYLFTQLNIKVLRIYNNKTRITRRDLMERTSNAFMGGAHPINPVIRNVTEKIPQIRLSLSDRVSLCAFPDTVLDRATQITVRALSQAPIRDPHKYFFKICLNICEGMGIKPDWRWVGELKHYYEVDKDPKDCTEINRALKEEFKIVPRTGFIPDAPKKNHYSKLRVIMIRGSVKVSVYEESVAFMESEGFSMMH